MNVNAWKNKLLRAPDGGSPAPADPTATPAVASAPAPDVPPPSPAPGPTFDWMPEQFRTGDAPDFDGFKAHYETLAARAAAVPETPDAYELTPPEGFELATDDPLLGDLRKTLHELGAPADGGGKVLDLLARYEEAQIARIEAERKAETDKVLGPSAQTRIADVKRALEARLPADMAAGLQSAIRNPVAVKALEKLLATPGLQTPAPAAPSTPDFDNLPPGERLKAIRAAQSAR